MKRGPPHGDPRSCLPMVVTWGLHHPSAYPTANGLGTGASWTCRTTGMRPEHLFARPLTRPGVARRRYQRRSLPIPM